MNTNHLTELQAEARDQLAVIWQVLEPEVCMRVKTHNTHTLEDYEPLGDSDIQEFVEKLIAYTYTQAIQDCLNALPAEDDDDNSGNDVVRWYARGKNSMRSLIKNTLTLLLNN